MIKTAKTELKPCPFCGGKANLEHDIMQYNGTPFEVYCENCGAKRNDYNEEDAIEGWNSRTNGKDSAGMSCQKDAYLDKKVVMIRAFEVYSADDFILNDGIVKHIVKHPFKDRGELVGFYAVCEFSDGMKQYEMVSKSTVEAAREKSGNQNLWREHYNDMAKKLVLKRLAWRVRDTIHALAASVG